MEETKYIGLIKEEMHEGFSIGYNPSSKLDEMITWKEEMLECNNIDECEIYELKKV